MEFIRGIVKFLSYICYLLIIIYALVWAPNLFEYRPLVVLTGSMEPTIKTGSVLYYKDVPEEELKVGDAITFSVNNQVVSHRIVSIENGLYETKGDANASPDAMKISYNNILGKDADISIPYVGYYVKFIGEHIYLLIVVVVILISEFLLGNRKLVKAEPIKKEETIDINKNNIIEEEEVL